MLFYANVFFNLQAGYFDSAAETKLFLHFWSLSLEEQYYFVWAPLIVLINRFTKRSTVIGGVLVAMLIASFTSGFLLNTRYPAFVFFQLPSRIWQFAAGAFTAVITRGPASSTTVVEKKVLKDGTGDQVDSVPLLQDPDHNIIVSDPDHTTVSIEDEQERSSAEEESDSGTKSVNEEKSRHPCEEDDEEVLSSPLPMSTNKRLLPLAKELLSWCAFLTLLGSYFFLPRSASMYLMLPTTISTCTILALGDTFFATHVLSLSFMRSLGHLSYSAYLVHWPIFVFSLHLCNSFGWDKPNAVLMGVVTLGTAMMLRHWVEDPVRRGDRRWVFGMMSVCTLMFTISVIITKGFPSRVGHINTDVSLGYQANIFRHTCQRYSRDDSRFSGLPERTCLIGDIEGNRSRYAFMGDSFTMHLTSALMDAGSRRKEWYIFHWFWGCKFAAKSMKQELARSCRNGNDEQWEVIDSLPSDNIVVVSNHWNIDWAPKFTKRSRSHDIQMLKNEISEAGHQMILVGEPPGVDDTVNGKYFACADVSILPLARLWAKLRGKEFKGADSCFDADKGLQPRPGRVDEHKEDVEMIPKVMPDMGYADVMSHLCREDNETKGGWSCRLPGNTTGIVYDTGYCRGATHYTVNGSRELSRFYEEEILDKVRLQV